MAARNSTMLGALRPEDGVGPVDHPRDDQLARDAGRGQPLGLARSSA